MTNEIAAKGIIAACQIFIGALLMACTTAARRDMLFGVRVPDGFRSGQEGRRAIAAFRTIMTIQLLLSLAAILLASGAQLQVVLLVVPLTTVLAAVLGFAFQHRRLKSFAVLQVQTREVELSNEPERLPWFLWLWPGPFVALAATAAYLRGNWDRIPERFPIHWGIDGEPNGWSERTFAGVYGPLMLGSQIVILLAVFALAGWFGARRSPLRPAIAGIAIAAEYSITCVIIAAALSPLVRAPLWVMLVAPLVILAPAVIHTIRKANQPRQAPDPTPDECWKGGMVYYNPSDAALMVERRDSVGLTVNFGNPWSWAILGFLVVNVATDILFAISR
jgi:uncharacterized membrane protein